MFSARYLRNFSFFYLYLLQGVPAGFALTAVSNYLTGKHLSPERLGSFAAIVGLPWLFQFVWGPVVDKYKYYFGNSQQRWVTLTQCFAVICSGLLWLIDDPMQQLGIMSLFFLMHSLAASIQDASVDTLAIHITAKGERGTVNAWMRGGFLLGIAFGAAALSTILHKYNFRTAAIVQTAILASGVLLTILVKLETSSSLTQDYHRRFSLPQLFTGLFAAFTRKHSLRLIGLLCILYGCFSIFSRSFNYHIITGLHVPDQDLSVWQGTWGSLATFTIVIAGGKIADKAGSARLMRGLIIIAGFFIVVLSIIVGLYGFPSLAVTGSLLWNFVDPLMSVCAFPLLMGICLPPVEGSQFTTYMACLNFCDILGSYISGWAMLLVPAPVVSGAAGGMMLLTMFLLYRKWLEPSMAKLQPA